MRACSRVFGCDEANCSLEEWRGWGVGLCLILVGGKGGLVDQGDDPVDLGEI